MRETVVRWADILPGSAMALLREARAANPRLTMDEYVILARAALREKWADEAALAADPDPTLISQLIETGRAEVER